jgi:hypothetical protein
LVRVHLFRLAADDHAVLLTIHHIVTDGLSMAILLSELGALYAARKCGERSPLTELPVQYVDYANWQRACWSTEAFQASVEYWKQKLGGIPPALEFPSDRRRPAVQTFHGAVEYFELPNSLQDALRELARRSGSTLFATLLAAFKALLYRYTGQSDLVVGTFTSNRRIGRSNLHRVAGPRASNHAAGNGASGRPLRNSAGRPPGSARSQPDSVVSSGVRQQSSATFENSWIRSDVSRAGSAASQLRPDVLVE